MRYCGALRAERVRLVALSYNAGQAPVHLNRALNSS